MHGTNVTMEAHIKKGKLELDRAKVCVHERKRERERERFTYIGRNGVMQNLYSMRKLKAATKAL